jgi:hypothetical protein
VRVAILGAMVANLVTWVRIGRHKLIFLTELLGRRKFHPQFLKTGQSILTLFLAAHKGFIIDLKKKILKKKRIKTKIHTIQFVAHFVQQNHGMQKPFNFACNYCVSLLAMHKK